MSKKEVKPKETKEVKKKNKVDLVAFFTLWIARVALATLAVAGSMNLLGGIDPIIAWPFTIVAVAFLLKETL